MNGYLVFGLVLVVLLALSLVLSKRASARRALRALHAHSEPGGPHAQHHDGASGMTAAKLADGAREWGGQG